MSAVERQRRYRAKHRERILARRRELRQKPCPDCGRPKPPGAGKHRCPDCEARHKAELNKARNVQRRGRCKDCGGPKPPGKGRHRCDNCEREYTVDGRIRVYLTGGGYVYRYRRIIEATLKQSLRPDEHVHHINGDSTDDRLENLQVLSASEHGALHGRWRPSDAR